MGARAAVAVAVAVATLWTVSGTWVASDRSARSRRAGGADEVQQHTGSALVWDASVIFVRAGHCLSLLFASFRVSVVCVEGGAFHFLSSTCFVRVEDRCTSRDGAIGHDSWGISGGIGLFGNGLM